MLPQKYAKTAGFSRYSSSKLDRRKWLLCSVVVAVVFLRSLHRWSCFEVPFRRMLRFFRTFGEGRQFLSTSAMERQGESSCIQDVNL